jgi:hypothetical protein
VQVVSGDDVNAIDLAMNSSAPETDGAAARTDSETRDRFKSADATPFLANEGKPDGTAVQSNKATSTGNEPARADEIARESWINRFWSAIGDGFVALVGMVRPLFG